MMLDVEILLKYYNEFVDIVKQVSLSADEQISKLYGFAIADEIALDFSEVGMVYAKKLFEYGCLSDEQFIMAKRLDEKFDCMSANKSLWSEKALKVSTEWEECRPFAKELLKLL